MMTERGCSPVTSETVKLSPKSQKILLLGERWGKWEGEKRERERGEKKEREREREMNTNIRITQAHRRNSPKIHTT